VRKAYWTPTSRRFRTAARPTTARFLEVLSRSAIAEAIAEGEKKTQDLRLNRQLP
jgi:hypothetical protein